jgi:hypothetical protein
MNYLEKSISFGIENEKCAIPFYQTTVPQREILLYYINSCPSARKLLPIQWRVEIADQCNGWFPAVAVHYRVRDHSFRVIVLDSKDPTRECYNGFGNTNKNNATVLVLLPLVNNKQQQIELHLCHSSITGGGGSSEEEMDKASREEFQRLIFEEHCPASWKARNQFLNNGNEKNKNHRNKKNNYNSSSSLCRDDNDNNQSSTSNECVICFHREVSDLAFIPCGHQVICEDCSLQFLPPSSSSSSSSSPSLTNNCPICRCTIQSVLKIYRC